jgi:trigger factor
VLEEIEGTLDDLRAKTREELAESLKNQGERDTIDSYIKQLVEQTEYDIPDAMIEQEADEMLHQRGHEFERYGISLEQMLQYRGQTHDEAVEELKPEAEGRLRNTLALREVVRAEGLVANDAEVAEEVDRIVDTYEEDQRERAKQLLSTAQFRPTIASTVVDKKLRDRLFQIATGTAPAIDAAPVAANDGAAAEAPTDSADVAVQEVSATAEE